jgi:hypothetical protein
VSAGPKNPEVLQNARRVSATQSVPPAERAEVIARVAEDPSVELLSVQRYHDMLGSNWGAIGREAADEPCDQRRQALNKYHELVALARWYREFADRAGSPHIWEARLRMAEDLECEAHRVERWLRPARGELAG